MYIFSLPKKTKTKQKFNLQLTESLMSTLQTANKLLPSTQLLIAGYSRNHMKLFKLNYIPEIIQYIFCKFYELRDKFDLSKIYKVRKNLNFPVIFIPIETSKSFDASNFHQTATRKLYKNDMRVDIYGTQTLIVRDEIDYHLRLNKSIRITWIIELNIPKNILESRQICISYGLYGGYHETDKTFTAYNAFDTINSWFNGWNRLNVDLTKWTLKIEVYIHKGEVNVQFHQNDILQPYTNREQDLLYKNIPNIEWRLFVSIQHANISCTIKNYKYQIEDNV